MANLKDFKTWLDLELEKRNWSYRELARRAGKNASIAKISLTLAGDRGVTWEFCLAIAGPLEYDPVEVFKIAGLLPKGKELNGEK